MPIQISAIPARIRARSRAFARRFLSLNSIAPQRNDIMTEPRLTRDTTEIIESGLFRELKYAKSAMQINTEMSGIAHDQWNGVV